MKSVVLRWNNKRWCQGRTKSPGTILHSRRLGVARAHGCASESNHVVLVGLRLTQRCFVIGGLRDGAQGHAILLVSPRLIPSKNSFASDNYVIFLVKPCRAA